MRWPQNIPCCQALPQPNNSRTTTERYRLKNSKPIEILTTFNPPDTHYHASPNTLNPPTSTNRTCQPLTNTSTLKIPTETLPNCISPIGSILTDTYSDSMDTSRSRLSRATSKTKETVKSKCFSTSKITQSK